MDFLCPMCRMINVVLGILKLSFQTTKMLCIFEFGEMFFDLKHAEPVQDAFQ